MTEDRILIMNNSGIGNGIIIFPFLIRLNLIKPGFRFWHVKNAIFENKAFRLHAKLFGYMGSVPPLWRRFSLEYQPFIIRFIRRHAIGTVINLRMQETELDLDYLVFKERFSSEVDFWDLHEMGDEIYMQSIHDTIRKLFERKTGEVFYNHSNWLSFLRKKPSQKKAPKRIGLYLGASQAKKRWKAFHWHDLIVHLLENEPYDIHLLPGLSNNEQSLAYKLNKSIDGSKRHRLSVTNSMDLWSFTRFISECEYLLTNDTFVSHLAAAIGVPQIVIFLVTDNKIWKPDYGCQFEFVQSQEPYKCSEFQRNGTCLRYYGICGRTCGKDVTARDVLKAWERLIRRNVPSCMTNTRK